MFCCRVFRCAVHCSVVLCCTLLLCAVLCWAVLSWDGMCCPVMFRAALCCRVCMCQCWILRVLYCAFRSHACGSGWLNHLLVVCRDFLFMAGASPVFFFCCDDSFLYFPQQFENRWNGICFVLGIDVLFGWCFFVIVVIYPHGGEWMSYSRRWINVIFIHRRLGGEYIPYTGGTNKSTCSAKNIITVII